MVMTILKCCPLCRQWKSIFDFRQIGHFWEQKKRVCDPCAAILEGKISALSIPTQQEKR